MVDCMSRGRLFHNFEAANIKVAFLLAKLFSDLDNPDCLGFCASWKKKSEIRLIHTVAVCCSDLLLNFKTSFSSLL